MPPPAPDALAPLRRRAFVTAYRMLGSAADAEDVAQEALLRLTRAEPAPDEPAAWVTTVATRLALDDLRSARARRERYVGPWLPEPLLTHPDPGPDVRAELDETLSQAFLVLLEQLSPAERAAFLLREAFGYDYAKLAAALDRSEDACRQLVSRARRHVQDGRPRFAVDAGDGARLRGEFLAAVEDGDVAGLEALLAEDCVLVADGGGRAIAARKPVVGAARVARFLVRTAAKRLAHGYGPPEAAWVNGRPGRLVRDPSGSVVDVLALDVVDGRIARLWVVRNPDKLEHLQGAGRQLPSPAA